MHPDHFFNKLIPEFWNSDMEKEFSEHAIREYPKEAVAAVIDNKLVILTNISNNSNNEFELSLEDSIKVQKAHGLIHSHPRGRISPSKADMISQLTLRIPFGVVTCTEDSCSRSIWWSDKTLDIVIENRPFIHGIFDCYSLVRSYYKQSRNITLKEYPRDDEWWNNKEENLYINNFKDAGFIELGHDSILEEGDVVLMKVATLQPAHAGVYIGNGLILHHLSNRISRKDRYDHWKKFITHRLRYSK